MGLDRSLIGYDDAEKLEGLYRKISGDISGEISRLNDAAESHAELRALLITNNYFVI